MAPEISYQDASNQDSCMYECQQMATCEWWTYDEPAQLCFFYETCDQVSTDCDGCITGQKACTRKKTIKV